jgi:hypothetical protein
MRLHWQGIDVTAHWRLGRLVEPCRVAGGGLRAGVGCRSALAWLHQLGLISWSVVGCSVVLAASVWLWNHPGVAQPWRAAGVESRICACMRLQSDCSPWAAARRELGCSVGSSAGVQDGGGQQHDVLLGVGCSWACHAQWACRQVERWVCGLWVDVRAYAWWWAALLVRGGLHAGGGWAAGYGAAGYGAGLVGCETTETRLEPA